MGIEEGDTGGAWVRAMSILTTELIVWYLYPWAYLLLVGEVSFETGGN